MVTIYVNIYTSSQFFKGYLRDLAQCLAKYLHFVFSILYLSGFSHTLFLHNG